MPKKIFVKSLMPISCCAMLLWSAASFAADVKNTQVANSQEQSSAVNSTSTNEAQVWNITPTDWQHYQTLMQGTAGKWYPQLTPAQVLAMYADNPQDQAHYAEMAAKAQHIELNVSYAMPWQFIRQG